MILGTGTDIVEVDRVARLVQRNGSRWFTPAELVYCQSKSSPNHHFAARLAAKEAVFKALGLPGDRSIPWSEIEIGHDETGRPVARTTGALLAAANQQHGSFELMVSLAHADHYATAVAIVVSG